MRFKQVVKHRIFWTIATILLLGIASFPMTACGPCKKSECLKGCFTGDPDPSPSCKGHCADKVASDGGDYNECITDPNECTPPAEYPNKDECEDRCSNCK